MQPFKDTTQFILILDAVGFHVEFSVLQAMGLTDMIWFLLIPSKLTWLLQPLDVAVFALVKRLLKTRYLDANVGPEAEKAAMRMIRILTEILPTLSTERSWKKVFRQTGLWTNQLWVSDFIKGKLVLEQVPLLPNTLPAYNELRLCWPSNRVPILAHIALALPLHPMLPLPALMDAAHDALPAPPLALEDGQASDDDNAMNDALADASEAGPCAAAPPVAASRSFSAAAAAAPAPPALRRRLTSKTTLDAP